MGAKKKRARSTLNTNRWRRQRAKHLELQGGLMSRSYRVSVRKGLTNLTPIEFIKQHWKCSEGDILPDSLKPRRSTPQGYSKHNMAIVTKPEPGFKAPKNWPKVVQVALADFSVLVPDHEKAISLLDAEVQSRKMGLRATKLVRELMIGDIEAQISWVKAQRKEQRRMVFNLRDLKTKPLPSNGDAEESNPQHTTSAQLDSGEDDEAYCEDHMIQLDAAEAELAKSEDDEDGMQADVEDMNEGR